MKVNHILATILAISLMSFVFCTTFMSFTYVEMDQADSEALRFAESIALCNSKVLKGYTYMSIIRKDMISLVEHKSDNRLVAFFQDWRFKGMLYRYNYYAVEVADAQLEMNRIYDALAESAEIAEVVEFSTTTTTTATTTTTTGTTTTTTTATTATTTATVTAEDISQKL